jgi:single-strand DNA-binding protein
MTDMITLTGLVATQPKHLVTSEGLSITSFRLASTQRRFDRSQERWIDGDTNWYTITTFRQLAINVVGSVHKGDRVIATGRLRIRDWTTGEKAGTNIEVDADAVGPDLLWGTAVFTRSISTAVAESVVETASEPSVASGADDEETSDEEATEESLDSLTVPF